MELLLILVLLALVFGGGSYGYRQWGYTGGLGVVGTVLIILLVLWLLGVLGDFPRLGRL